MTFQTFTGFGALPGLSAVRENVEQDPTWGPWEYNQAFILPTLLDGATRDAGHTSATTRIRPGLLMEIQSTKKAKEWAFSEPLLGVMLYEQQVQQDGSNADRWFGYVLTSGLVQASRLLVPGATSYGLSGNANETHIRNALRNNGFILDDEIGYGHNAPFGTRQLTKTADYTVTLDDNGVEFNNLGDADAITFTLPAVANCKGFRASFLNCVNQDMTIQSAAANGLITFNNAAASSVAFSTTNEKIGGHVEVIGVSATKYFVKQHGANTMTVA